MDSATAPLLDNDDPLTAEVIKLRDAVKEKERTLAEKEQALSDKELIEFVGGRIARYKKPQYVQFVASLPEKNGSLDRETIKVTYGGEQTGK